MAEYGYWLLFPILDVILGPGWSEPQPEAVGRLGEMFSKIQPPGFFQICTSPPMPEVSNGW